MTKPELDWSAPYGTIYPPLADGSFYEQYGLCFNKDGQPIGVSGDAGAVDAAPAPRGEEKATKDEGVAEDIDLAAWARGEIKPPFYLVKKAMADRFPGADNGNSGEIINVLINEGVVTADEVKR